MMSWSIANYCRALTRNGYKTTKVSNGNEAMERIASEPFDLVLLDVIMPGMDGMECLAKIRAQFSMNVARFA